MEWYEAAHPRWQAEQAIARRLLEDVEVGYDEQRRAFINGSLPLVSAHGHQWDVFRLRIVYPELFPRRRCCPGVFLESHHDKWRTGPDTHIEDDWKLCLFVPVESDIDFQRDDSLERLLSCVRTFLAKERIYQRDLVRQRITRQPAVWPGEARSHGPAGIREAIVEHGRIRRNDPCPCGSGKKFKRCCMEKLDER